MNCAIFFVFPEWEKYTIRDFGVVFAEANVFVFVDIKGIAPPMPAMAPKDKSLQNVLLDSVCNFILFPPCNFQNIIHDCKIHWLGCIL